MNRWLASATVTFCVAITLATGSASSARADDVDDETAFAEVQDDHYVVGDIASHLAVRIDDTPMATSDASLDAILASYEEHDVVCALRQYAAAEAGIPLNEIEDLCESDEGPTLAEIAGTVSSEFKTLPLVAPAISYQPEGDWALVNMDFIVFTDAGQQLLDTTVLGVPVTVRATPVSYSWDFDDGSAPLVTTDSGQPYPDHTLAHVYTSAADAVEVSLTTSWQGEFQINGAGAWLPIAGFATTTSSAPPVEIVAMDVHLVP